MNGAGKHDATTELMARMQRLAEGKIACECGNHDWGQFLYVAMDMSDNAIAGCKRCGRTYAHHANGLWEPIKPRTV